MPPSGSGLRSPIRRSMPASPPPCGPGPPSAAHRYALPEACRASRRRRGLECRAVLLGQDAGPHQRGPRGQLRRGRLGSRRRGGSGALALRRGGKTAVEITAARASGGMRRCWRRIVEGGAHLRQTLAIEPAFAHALANGPAVRLQFVATDMVVAALVIEDK